MQPAREAQWEQPQRAHQDLFVLIFRDNGSASLLCHNCEKLNNESISGEYFVSVLLSSDSRFVLTPTTVLIPNEQCTDSDLLAFPLPFLSSSSFSLKDPSTVKDGMATFPTGGRDRRLVYGFTGVHLRSTAEPFAVLLLVLGVSQTLLSADRTV